MWIMTSDCFVSITEHPSNKHSMLVCGRFPGDAERFLRHAGRHTYAETITAEEDYRYRIEAPRDTVAKAAANATRGIDYGDFNSTARVPWRSRLYRAVWHLLYREQEQQVDRNAVAVED
jgi:hypothetical protein